MKRDVKLFFHKQAQSPVIITMRLVAAVMIFAVATMQTDKLYAAEMGVLVNGYVNNLGVDPYISITDKKNRDYANKVASSTDLGTSSAFVLGNLGADTVNYKGYALVASPVEYYYTDLVFLKQDYETAIKTLYSQRKEDPKKAKECNEAVDSVVEIAKRRGISISLSKVESDWKKEKTAEIYELAKQYNCGESEVKLIMDYYFNGLAYKTFIKKLNGLYQKDHNAANAILYVLDSMNGKFRDAVGNDMILALH